MKTVLASNNKRKLAELLAIMKEDLPGNELLLLSDIGFTGDIEENGSTFEENSKIKASVPASLGYIGIADDSGLCVDALGGAPGVYSARYSGKGDEENIDRLLYELRSVPDEKRTARFVCVMTAAFPDGRIIRARGEAEGLILRERRGVSGFGYDPVFYYPPLHASFAEIGAEEKNRISHRAKALAAFCPLLKKELLKC
ncbi:MAG: RdgB/HAM1 family non-canonical purine NTP pyrophosphatase [Clostridia bacterium]|nr:RdgB/HAM1 family non-canonical purine NTP pyrophosphatase [Clostridia bacterium]